MTKKSTKAQRHDVAYLPIDKIKPDPKNARVHPPEQIAQLRASIREFGFTQPILLRPNGIVGAGHGRLAAAIEEGLKEVPTITLKLSEKQWRAYAIADNQIPQGATWDLAMLRQEVDALEDSGLDLVALGFDNLPDMESPEHPELQGGGGAGTRVSQTVIQFNLVFETVEQQGEWHEFVRKLKVKYPNEETLAGRISKFLKTVKL